MIPISASFYYVPAYQMSGIPFLSASIPVPANATTRVDFPSISKFVSVRNDTSTSTTSRPIRVGFDSSSVQFGSNYTTIGNRETVTLDQKASRIYLHAPSTATSATLMCGLTNIDSRELPTNWSGSTGVTSENFVFVTVIPQDAPAVRYNFDIPLNESATGGDSHTTTLSSSTSYIISIWVKPWSGAPVSAHNIVCSWVSTSLSTYTLGMDASNIVHFRAVNDVNEPNNSTASFSVSSSTTLVDDQWYHLAGYVDRTTVSLYVNGVLEGTRSDKQHYRVSTRPYFLGNSGGGVVNGVVPGPWVGHFRDMAAVVNLSPSGSNILDAFTQNNGGTLIPNDLTSSALLSGKLRNWYRLGPGGDTAATFLRIFPNNGLGSLTTGGSPGPIIDPTGSIEFT